jgi:hypothetical protein
MEERTDTAECIKAEAAVIAAAAEDCIAAGASLEAWRRRVMAAIGRVGTLLPVFKTGRRPNFFADLDVRECLIGLHREVTIEAAVAVCRERFGEARTPSRSAVQRFWRYLDRLQQEAKKR